MQEIPPTKSDFYVGPGGAETTLPATAYRYMRYQEDDGSLARFANSTMENRTAPVSYFGFVKHETGKGARAAFQIKGPEAGPDENGEGSWSDARLRGEFDTLQLYENGEPQVRVPYWKGDSDETKKEPFAEAYPQYGQGGEAQLHADGKFVDFDSVDILPEE
ncbi:hypothetical protein QQM79_03425 [Marinobacteraceae bacterium S3BR75-40.1]